MRDILSLLPVELWKICKTYLTLKGNEKDQIRYCSVYFLEILINYALSFSKKVKLENWLVIRSKNKRFRLIYNFLSSSGILPFDEASYLDLVNCSLRRRQRKKEKWCVYALRDSIEGSRLFTNQVTFLNYLSWINNSLPREKISESKSEIKKDQLIMIKFWNVRSTKCIVEAFLCVPFEKWRLQYFLASFKNQETKVRDVSCDDFEYMRKILMMCLSLDEIDLWKWFLKEFSHSTKIGSKWKSEVQRSHTGIIPEIGSHILNPLHFYPLVQHALALIPELQHKEILENEIRLTALTATKKGNYILLKIIEEKHESIIFTKKDVVIPDIVLLSGKLAMAKYAVSRYRELKNKSMLPLASVDAIYEMAKEAKYSKLVAFWLVHNIRDCKSADYITGEVVEIAISYANARCLKYLLQNQNLPPLPHEVLQIGFQKFLAKYDVRSYKHKKIRDWILKHRLSTLKLFARLPEIYYHAQNNAKTKKVLKDIVCAELHKSLSALEQTEVAILEKIIGSKI